MNTDAASRASLSNSSEMVAGSKLADKQLRLCRSVCFESPITDSDIKCNISAFQNFRKYRLTSTNQTSYQLPPLPHPFPPLHRRILIIDEYGARLKLMDAICHWREITPAPVFFFLGGGGSLFIFSLPPTCLSGEKSVSVISDIYSRRGSRLQHALH